jgi:PAS domain S-box-containing protein
MSAASRRSRVLVVEDEPITAADLRASVENLGYEIAGVVNSGLKAIRAALDASPDVVLMDIRLKGTMDGITAADEIRKNSGLPVIFVSGSATEDVVLRASIAGAYGFVLKPFRAKELNAAIVLALQQHQLARDLFLEQTWLRTMLQNLSDAVFAADTHGRVRYINRAGEILAGCTLAEAADKPIEGVCRLTTLANEPVETCPLRAALRTGLPVEKARFLLHSRDGRVTPVEKSASPIEVNGEIAGAVSVVVDISERVRSERLQELERERLEEQVHVTSSQLGQTRAELRALSGYLITAQEEERRRVARELHDDLAQSAAVVGLELESLDHLLPPDGKGTHEILRSVTNRVSDLGHQVREISHRLHPSVVQDLGLPLALRGLVDDYNRNGASVTCIQSWQDPRLPLDVATAFYRIAQEALRNASRHAEGAPVRVVLEPAAGGLQLRVEDAGPGFDLNRLPAKPHLGLLSMQERARLVGATFLLQTAPGDGTSIRVRVPLPVMVSE